jgi:hypothetical protein
MLLSPFTLAFSSLNAILVAVAGDKHPRKGGMKLAMKRLFPFKKSRPDGPNS